MAFELIFVAHNHYSTILSSYITIIFRYTNLDSLIAVGCDGTNVNTGNAGGIIALLEKHLNKPLQWLVCQLHANELPLRHLLKYLDGETCGPRAFKGVIGKQLAKYLAKRYQLYLAKRYQLWRLKR